VGRYGPYLQHGEDRVSIPDDLAPDELTVERAESLLEAPSSDRVLGEDPETGLPVQVRAGRFGPYVQLGELVDGGPKPRTSSLFASMSPETITFEQALELLRVPRVVGLNDLDDRRCHPLCAAGRLPSVLTAALRERVPDASAR